MILLPRKVDRRSVLRGSLGAGAVSVALPFLDCFLTDNGALASTGAPLPVRFGTWFWGLGHTPGRGVAAPKGPELMLLEETQALAPYKQHINYFSNFNTP